MNRGPQSKTTFGDVCLEDLDIVVERVHDDAPSVEYDTVDVTSMDGNVYVGSRLEPRTITLECRAFKDKWQDFELLKDELAKMLMYDNEAALSVRNHPGEHYMAHLTSISEGDRIGGTGIGYLELSFTASCPYRIGVERSVTVPSGSSVTFLVGGSIPPTVSIEASAGVRDASTNVWGIRFDEGDFIHVALPTSSATALSIECGERNVIVAGETAMVTLDSNWPILNPGRHVARMDLGTGVATLKWRERSI